MGKWKKKMNGIQYLLIQCGIFCGIIKYEKFANYFIKVLYGLWHFNDVYRGLEETKAWSPMAVGQNLEQLCVKLNN